MRFDQSLIALKKNQIEHRKLKNILRMPGVLFD